MGVSGAPEYYGNDERGSFEGKVDHVTKEAYGQDFFCEFFRLP